MKGTQFSSAFGIKQESTCNAETNIKARDDIKDVLSKENTIY